MKYNLTNAGKYDIITLSIYFTEVRNGNLEHKHNR